jgi:Peptidogalycan biosysnthesis/recognition
MGIGFTSAIADFDQRQFDSLDATAGAKSSYGRLRQKEEDGRWVTRYLSWQEDGLVKAVIPVYRSRMQSWPDAAYDPRTWNLPERIGGECSPAASLVVGGCADRRTGLHADGQARAPGQLRRLLAAVARLAADEGRCLVFPYMYTDARDALAAATEDRITWAKLDREAHLLGLSDPQWESTLPSKVRNALRRDRRKIADVPMTVEEASWDAVDPWAAELIALHNTRKGEQDRSEYASFRHFEWQRNPAVDLITFTALSDGLRGVQTALLWKSELEMYAIGLAGEESVERFAVYVNLLFHMPIQYARSRGIDHIRFGVKAETAKSTRGAVFEDLHGGVLGIDETNQLARDSA